MPTYEYKCPECGSAYSETRTIKEYEAIRDKPCWCISTEHDAVEMRRVYSAPRHFTIQGLHPDRFKVKDQVARNRQAAHDAGEL